MAEFILNPRRALRAPARCRTAVVSGGASFEAETEDIGSRGCQVVSPRSVKKGDAVRLTIANDHVPEPLRVTGRIAWVSAQFPWRVGIAFDEAALPETTAWFGRLVDAHPGMRLKRLPERIPVEAMVYLGTPPRFVVDFNADEAALLRAIGNGTRVDELIARFRFRGEAIERAMFSLIARSAVTLVRGNAVHPHTWKPVIDEIEASLAVESLGMGPATLAAPAEDSSATPAPAATPVPAARAPAAAPTVLPSVPPVRARTSGGTPVPGAFGPAISPFGTPPQDPSREVELQDSSAPVEIEVEVPAPRGAARAVETGSAWGTSVPAPDHDGKGGGWRKAARERPPEAQAAYERAHVEFLAGNVNAAITLLRRALSLSPGDAAIAEVLGKLAFRDRDPGGR